VLDFIATSPAKICNPAPKTEEERIHRSALKSREHKRLNSLKILRFNDTDRELIQQTKAYADAFVDALALSGTISEDQIQAALQQAHIASDGYYSVEHAKQWNTTFEFPAEAIAADAALLDSCGNDFTLMCQTKQSKLAHNRIFVKKWQLNRTTSRLRFTNKWVQGVQLRRQLLKKTKTSRGELSLSSSDGDMTTCSQSSSDCDSATSRNVQAQDTLEFNLNVMDADQERDTGMCCDLDSSLTGSSAWTDDDLFLDSFFGFDFDWSL